MSLREFVESIKKGKVVDRNRYCLPLFRIKFPLLGCFAEESADQDNGKGCHTSFIRMKHSALFKPQKKGVPEEHSQWKAQDFSISSTFG